MFNNILYFAFKDQSSDNYLNLTGSYDGVNFNSPSIAYSGARMNGSNEIGPALNVFNGSLFYLFVSNDGNHNLDVVHNY